MSKRSHNFREHGIPGAAYHASMRATNIFVSTEIVPAVSGASIVLVDMIVAKDSDGTFMFFDGTDFLLDLYLTNMNGPFNKTFGAPVKLEAGNALKVRLLDSDTDWGILITYYLDYN